MDRRGFLALAAVSLAEMRHPWVAKANDEDEECVAEGDNCNGNKVCCEGLVCETTGNENEKECQPGTPPVECEHDDDCPDGQVCRNGVCRPIEPPPECRFDRDCRGDEQCVNGLCRRLCLTDGDCTSPAVCRSGICIVVTLTNTTNVFVPPSQTTILTRRRRRRKGHRRHKH
jgi:Cys-rich repeat protein